MIDVVVVPGCGAVVEPGCGAMIDVVVVPGCGAQSAFVSNS